MLIDFIHSESNDRIKSFLANLNEAITEQEFDQSTVFSRMAVNAETALSGQQSLHEGMIGVVDAILVASPTELELLAKSISDGTTFRRLSIAFKVSGRQIPKIINAAILSAEAFNAIVQDLLVGANRRLANEQLHARMAQHYGIDGTRFVSGPGDILWPWKSSLYSLSDGDESLGIQPILEDVIRHLVYLENGLGFQALGPKSRGFHNVVTGDKHWYRMEALARMLGSQLVRHDVVSLKVEGEGARYYSRLRSELSGRMVTGASMTKQGDGIEFRGRFKSIVSASHRYPLIFMEPSLGRLKMEITIEVDGTDIVVPIYNNTSILYVDRRD